MSGGTTADGRGRRRRLARTRALAPTGRGAAARGEGGLAAVLGEASMLHLLALVLVNREMDFY